MPRRHAFYFVALLGACLAWALVSWVTDDKLWVVGAGVSELHPGFVLVVLTIGVPVLLRGWIDGLWVFLFLVAWMGCASLVLGFEGQFPYVHSVMVLLLLSVLVSGWSLRYYFDSLE